MGLLVWLWFVRADIALLGIPWLMGVAIAYLPSFPSSGRWTRGGAIAAAVFLLGCGLAMGRWRCTLTTSILLGLTVVFFIWVLLHCATSPLPSLYVKVAQRSARSSYTLYLVHLPLLCFLKATLHLPRTAPNWHMILVSSALLAWIFAYAQLFYELFEKNTDKVRNWIMPYVMGEGSNRDLPIGPLPAGPIVASKNGTMVSSVFP
jgi:peptidoglycan/LPS O-acetylase OafA/YrhL